VARNGQTAGAGGIERQTVKNKRQLADNANIDANSWRWPRRSPPRLHGEAQQAIERARWLWRGLQLTFKEGIFGSVEKAGFTFLITDLELGMTLTRIASDASEDLEKRARNRANARRAYDAVCRISHHASLDHEQRQEVDAKLAGLRSALEQLGEVFA
jgi:hypothetical protein